MGGLRSLLTTGAACAALGLVAASAQATPGSPDTAFGGTGAVDAGPGSVDLVAVDSARRVVTFGNAPGALPTSPPIVVLRRRLASGAADASFATNGQVALTPGDDVRPGGLALGADGSIFVAFSGAHDSYVKKYTPDGQNDPDFGQWTGHYSYPSGTVQLHSSQRRTVGLVVLGDGAVRVLQSTAAGPPEIQALLPDGEQDSSFGGGDGGEAVPGLGPDQGVWGQRHLNRLAVRADGTLVAGGNATNGLPAVAELRPDGSPVSTYGHLGVAATAPAGVTAVLSDLRLAGDGTVTAIAGAGLTRLRPDGATDRTFGTSGAVTLDAAPARQSEIDAAVVQPDGSTVIVIGPSTISPPPVPPPVALRGGRAIVKATLSPTVPVPPAVARLTPTGAVDCTFGTFGVAQVPASTGTTRLGTLALDGDRVLAGGSTISAAQVERARLDRLWLGSGSEPELAAPAIRTFGVVPGGRAPAYVRAWIDPRCHDGAWSLQYGTSTAYGKTVAGGALTAAGGPRNVAASIPAPTVGIYHYRVVFRWVGGTVPGPDATFTVADLPGRLSLVSRRVTVAKGAARLAVRCTDGACPKATLTVRAGGRVVARGTVSIAAGRSGHAIVRLTTAGRRLARAHRTAKATVSMAVPKGYATAGKLTLSSPGRGDVRARTPRAAGRPRRPR